MKSLLLAAVCVAANLMSSNTAHEDLAPVYSSANAQVIDDSYMIFFKSHVTEQEASDHHIWLQNLHLEAEASRRSQFPMTDSVFTGLRHTYNLTENMVGYSGHFDPYVIESIRRHPTVAWIEKDAVSTAMEYYPSSDELYHTANVQQAPPWGLARISQRPGLTSNAMNYSYADAAGEGVDIYIMDTGINLQHVDFGGRASWGVTFTQGEGDYDANGHGTHCAGTAAGGYFGVAKKANLIAVKVLRRDSTGAYSDFIAGMNWVINSHRNAAGSRRNFKGSVLNMSLGGDRSYAVDNAANAVFQAGIHTAIAAGNNNINACNVSPAAALYPITVAASTISDTHASFSDWGSNWGQCVDIYGPGAQIQSAWIGNNYANNVISGTSMATPHVAGLMAYFLSLYPSMGVLQMKQYIINLGTKNSLSGVPGGTPNNIIYNGFAG